MKESSSKKTILMIVSIVYIAALLVFKFIPKSTTSVAFHWVPFSAHYFTSPILFLLINLIIAIPLGLIIGNYWKGNILMIAVGIVFCFAIEFLPAIIKIGSLDSTTILAYIVGTIVGYLAITLWNNKKANITA